MANSVSARDKEASKEIYCEICHDTLSKYCCPRCNILYCSLNCYQNNLHLQCSEYFYKENVLKEISLNNTDTSKASTSTQMLEILKSNCEGATPSFETLNTGLGEDFDGENSDSDDDSYVDIAERLEGVNLDDAEQVWDKLNQDERQEFIAFLRSEDVTDIIPSWTPWWSYTEHIVEDVSSSEDYKLNCPSICEIKDISQITKKTPSECVKYNLINIISAYAFTTRYFNGEYFDFAKEAVSCIISISLALKAAANFENFETAVSSVQQECINSNWIVTDESNFKTLKEDLQKILTGPTTSENKFYIICALSDFKNLLIQSLKPLKGDKKCKVKSEFPSEHFSPVEVEAKGVKKCIKKVEYYLSFTKYGEFSINLLPLHLQ